MSHCGIKNCEKWQVEGVVALLHVSGLDFHLRETGGIDFSQLPNPMQGVISVSARPFSQFLMLD
jgi:hypothetical protein